VRALLLAKWACVLLASVLILGCDESPVSELEGVGEAPPEADIVVSDLEDAITLGFGQTVYIESEKLCLTFTDMIGDSRCPMDAYCFWPGQAEIELSLRKRGGMEDFVVLVLPADRDPLQDPELFECSYGYRIYFLGLGPYPQSGHTVPDESYVARIYLEPDPGCCLEGEVCFTWVSPFLLQRDPFTLSGASIDGDELTVDVSYSGGCREHGFKLYMRPVFAESDPVRANLYLSHNGNGDFCRALISESLTFDLRKVADLYSEEYGPYGDIILEIFGYFTDQPGDGFEVTYSPIWFFEVDRSVTTRFRSSL
jgi:hypothetical protein